MIFDFDALEDGLAGYADVCVIGSGAAGITIAREFFNTDIKVILIESGGVKSEHEIQKLYDADSLGVLHDGIINGRARILGGTTTLWGGQALPLDAIDFSDRSWVAYSGWPLTRTELDPYYRRAEQVMHLNEISYDERVWTSFGIQPPDYDSTCLRSVFSQFTRKPNFAKTYSAELKAAQNVEVIFHANVINIVADESGSAVERVDIKSLSNKSGSIKARFYVICCGGIETARLLLASNQIDANGLGNRYDLVGRFFMDHIHIRCGEVRPESRKQFHHLYNYFYTSGAKFYPKISASEALQKREKILNITGDITFESTTDSGIEMAKGVMRDLKNGTIDWKTITTLVKTIKRPTELFLAGYRYLWQKRSYAPMQAPIYFGVQCEQAPNPESRVFLGDAVDQLGMRRIKINWQLSELDRRTISVFTKAVELEFKEAQLGAIDLTAFLIALEEGANWEKMVRDANHHMGTTRMHIDPRHGVVNADCRVHGISNLYIGSSSVFPTGSYSNPTLTIIALCLRISDHLKVIMK